MTDADAGMSTTVTAGSGTTATGTVVAFDGDVGLGTIATDDGVTYDFHCVGIADGTRQIDVGAAVAFTVLAKFGRYEATDITS